MTELHWLPALPDWRQRLRALPANPATAWDNAVALANVRLNFVLTNALDEVVRRVMPNGPETLATKKVRLAVLGSSTLAHLLPGIRVAGLRRGIWIDTYENDYGQYLQELSEAGSPLHDFKPTAVLVALDAYHLTAGVTAGMDADTAAGGADRNARPDQRGLAPGARSVPLSHPPAGRACRCTFRCLAITNIGCPDPEPGS